MAKRELPDTPSKLILLAVEDLEAIEKDKRYEVDMDFYHFPVTNTKKYLFGLIKKKEDVCLVCFAGAVMAKSLNANPDLILRPLHFVENRKLLALDEFRRGNWATGIFKMTGGREPDIDNTTVIPYKEDPELFKATMKAMAGVLDDMGF